MIPLELTAAAADANIKKKFGSGTTTLVISSEKMNDIMEIVKSVEESGLLLINVSEAIKNEAKKQKGGFFDILLCIKGASLLGNLSTDKGVVRAGKGTIRAGKNFGCCLIL